MPDEPASAASSAAAAEPDLPALHTLTSAELHNWRMTGNFPEPKPAQAAEPTPAAVEAATAKPSETSPPTGEKAVETAPAPEPGSVQEPPKKPEGEKRKGQLATEIQQLLKQRAELRSENERLRAEREAPPPAAAAPAEPAVTLKRPTIPQEAKFESIEEYEQARATYETDLDKYLSDLAESKVSAAIAADRQQREIEAHNRFIQQQEHFLATSWNQKAGEYQKAHPEVSDYEEVTELALEEIPENSLLDNWILQSEHGPALLVHLGRNLEEIGKINSLAPFSAARELHNLELSLRSNGTNKVIPAAVKITAATKPPRTLSGRATPPEDQVEAALDADDTGAYIKAANARDALTRKE